MDWRVRWLQGVNRWRSVYLLVLLVFLLGAYPHIVGASGEGRTLFSALFSLVMLAGLYSVSRNRWRFALVALLLLPSMVGNWIAFEDEGKLVLNGLTAMFFFVMAGLVLHYVFVARARIGDRLCGALSVYLLIGMAFAQLYEAVYAVYP